MFERDKDTIKGTDLLDYQKKKDEKEDSMFDFLAINRPKNKQAKKPLASIKNNHKASIKIPDIDIKNLLKIAAVIAIIIFIYVSYHNGAISGVVNSKGVELNYAEKHNAAGITRDDLMLHLKTKEKNHLWKAIPFLYVDDGNEETTKRIDKEQEMVLTVLNDANRKVRKVSRRLIDDLVLITVYYE